MGREETEESRDWSTGGEPVTGEPKDKRGNRRREKGRDSISQRKERAEREREAQSERIEGQREWKDSNCL